ncbi:SDR family NAD(P)-dependent oxidoreductase [Actinomadura rugatobispora]|uniref:SDR family NAD(P)-dependent oxidoreductase n=1 Tax=Actinomadura rugatobispora TaxID=1994 RepID=A0ABW0ZV12_9ACTN|nr:hypothetical protein GCM10010200_111340 [Actinomadura rugatobispora]
MSDHLAGKVIVITGAGSGFGKIIAEMTAARGAHAVGADIDADALTATIDGIRAAGHTAAGLPTDVTDKAQTDALARFGVVNHKAVMGLVGQRAAGYQEKTGRLVNGSLTAAETDPDSIGYFTVPKDCA